ncbi:MAG: YbjN domain-containing protein [Maritimibacter sp.]|nr:YbjN domain-containing protein [Maritimibacter sp.]
MKLGTYFATFALAAGLSAGLGTGAQAQQLLASDPQTFVDFFATEGYRPELREDTVGDPMVMFRNEGKTEYLLFYDCTDNADCLSVQFFTIFQMDEGVPLEVLNDWNSGMLKRFTRAYTYDQTKVRLDMDIATSQDGISARDFGVLMKLWLMRKDEFEEKIGY